MMPLDIFPLPKEAWSLGIGAIIAALIGVYVAHQNRVLEMHKQSRQILHDLQMQAQERTHQERLAYQERMFTQQTKLEDRSHEWQIKQAEWARGQSQVQTNYPGMADPSWLSRMPQQPQHTGSRLPGAKIMMIISVLLLGSCGVVSLYGQGDNLDTLPPATAPTSLDSPNSVPADPSTNPTVLAEEPDDEAPTPAGDDLDRFFEDVRTAADAQVDDPDPDAMKAYFDFPLGWFGGNPLSVKEFGRKVDGRGRNRIDPAEWLKTCWRDDDIVRVSVKVPYEVRATGERPKPDRNLYDVRLTGDPDDPFRIINIENGAC